MRVYREPALPRMRSGLARVLETPRQARARMQELRESYPADRRLREANEVREVARLLHGHGYAASHARRLVKEGYGPYEIEHRIATHQLGFALGVPRTSLQPKHRRTR